MGDTTAWLMLAAGDDRARASNDGYDDDPSSHYSWDDTVPNHGKPAQGHVIVLWDKRYLLGASVIEKIDEGTAEKDVHSCPQCDKARIETRTTALPRLKCYNCGHEFDVPRTREKTVKTYRTRHGAGWVELEGRLDGAQLRALCLSPKSQLSLRPLDYDRFHAALDGELALAPLEAAAEYVAGGHATAVVRVRRGQSAFRGKLLARYGSECAFSGPAPADALEAAHLYSYAEIGEHRKDGGFLLRRDLHRLFDRGLLAVNPDTRRLDVHVDIRHLQDYGQLHGKELGLDPTRAQREWLRTHWEQARPTSPGAA
ncbi:HNH endonuclease signature motif containing protein [Lentzea sp.]|uniref:HNH endonuclease n=1 Tax=Lentzea sp. TaxID=56099 RepID=UPI002C72B15B|nr:HNH endonuclease signature motif containing protein [Lentzea sp.]HUQ58801.1 HNH endonuclease signature motif containing protein [Lentzea sp.]